MSAVLTAGCFCGEVEVLCGTPHESVIEEGDHVHLSSAALGGLLGGYVGDYAAKGWPHHGRIAACQFSVSIGIPFSVLILKVDNLHHHQFEYILQFSWKA